MCHAMPCILRLTLHKPYGMTMGDFFFLPPYIINHYNLLDDGVGTFWSKCSLFQIHLPYEFFFKFIFSMIFSSNSKCSASQILFFITLSLIENVDI